MNVPSNLAWFAERRDTIWMVQSRSLEKAEQARTEFFLSQQLVRPKESRPEEVRDDLGLGSTREGGEGCRVLDRSSQAAS